jgi:RimJ/RimL family protein N-acetyltransferase
MEHAPGLFAVGQNDEDWRYLPIPGLRSRAQAEQWIGEALELAHQGSQVPFTQLDAKTRTPIGSTRYMNIRRRDRGLEIGYTFLGRAYQRTGVNTEAKWLLLRHAFEALGALRVEFKTDARNLRSQTAIARLGASREGVFRKHMLVQNDFVRDSVYYSIIAEEWPGIRERLQQLLGTPA